MSRKTRSDGETIKVLNPPDGIVELFFPFLDAEGRPGIRKLMRYAPFLMVFWIPQVKSVYYLPRWESLN